MVTGVDVAFVAVGAVLLFAGAALSIYGVGTMGLLLGGGGGFLAAPTVGGLVGLTGPVAIVAAVGIGALAGVAVTYILLQVAVASVAFVVGTYAGLIVAEPLLEIGSLFVKIPVAIGLGLAAALLGLFLTRTAMILITSFLGAALAARLITVENLQTAQNSVTLDPVLFDPVSPLFAALAVLGVLSQFGLFKLGWVAKLVAVLPGAFVFTDDEN